MSWPAALLVTLIAISFVFFTRMSLTGVIGYTWCFFSFYCRLTLNSSFSCRYFCFFLHTKKDMCLLYKRKLDKIIDTRVQTSWVSKGSERLRPSISFWCIFSLFQNNFWIFLITFVFYDQKGAQKTCTWRVIIVMRDRNSNWGIQEVESRRRLTREWRVHVMSTCRCNNNTKESSWEYRKSTWSTKVYLEYTSVPGVYKKFFSSEKSALQCVSQIFSRQTLPLQTHTSSCFLLLLDSFFLKVHEETIIIFFFVIMTMMMIFMYFSCLCYFDSQVPMKHAARNAVKSIREGSSGQDCHAIEEVLQISCTFLFVDFLKEVKYRSRTKDWQQDTHILSTLYFDVLFIDSS